MIIDYLTKIIIIFLLLVSYSLSKEIDEVLFTTKNNIYTTIDLENRIIYLKLIDPYAENISYESHIDDLISVAIFNEFAKENKVKVNKDIIKDYTQKIKSLNETLKINEKNLKKNIIFDYQRKLILENIINKNFENINQNFKILDLYNIKINYLIIESNNLQKIKNLNNENNFKDLNIVKELLNKENINFEIYEKEINNLQNLHPQIKNALIDNKKLFYLEEDYITIGSIDRRLKNNLNLKYTIFQVKQIQQDNKLIDNLQCENIEKLKTNNNYEIKVFEKLDENKLNNEIKKELNFINDRVKIKSNNQTSYIILCKLDYDYKMIKNEIMDKKLNFLAKQIENDFVLENKIKYNFSKYE